MFSVVKGLSLLVLTLLVFSIFSLKAKKGDKAMSGLAGAAVATFLVEAVHKYISGDFLGLDFLGEVGLSSGSMGGVIAIILVSLNMGVNPIYSAVAGAAMSGLDILPGFIAGYIIGILAPYLEKILPKGLDIILGALLIAPIARIIGTLSTPVVDSTLHSIGEMIQMSATQSPILMGFFLGGIMKIMCTSPLSSMALTAMLGLEGLAMGIASIASFAGAFTNFIVFRRLKLGEKGSTLAVMLEPLTQADIITKNPLPIYISDFIGGGLGGIIAAYLGIVNNAPGTASPIPGMLAPFGFNEPSIVLLALGVSAIGGIIGGYIGTYIYISYKKLRANNRKRKLVLD
ncbi:PTS sugar transporter subunit IIC [Clostridium sp. D2Q-14]|uniref:PTS sugar transporter subunit IIC n=1 Tax=Anaeromonas gelatinilytica TaxID=2683194 RepID=UPI00193BC95E|nr:PTS sugar transporter subunit IIC [Anaeromonas gelatinilytica]MBS4536560.1 PTS sugar transporter subunit IIC [Anaeromonas gelatinilytica]